MSRIGRAIDWDMMASRGREGISYTFNANDYKEEYETKFIKEAPKENMNIFEIRDETNKNVIFAITKDLKLEWRDSKLTENEKAAIFWNHIIDYIPRDKTETILYKNLAVHCVAFMRAMKQAKTEEDQKYCSELFSIAWKKAENLFR